MTWSVNFINTSTFTMIIYITQIHCTSCKNFYDSVVKNVIRPSYMTLYDIIKIRECVMTGDLYFVTFKWRIILTKNLINTFPNSPKKQNKRSKKKWKYLLKFVCILILLMNIWGSRTKSSTIVKMYKRKDKKPDTWNFF